MGSGDVGGQRDRLRECKGLARLPMGGRYVIEFLLSSSPKF